MRTKKKTAFDKPLPGFSESIEESAAREVREAKEEVPASTYRPNSKMQIPINEDGTIDIDSMREANRQRLKDAIRDTPGLKEVAPQVAEVQIFHPAMVSGMYDMLGSLEAMVAQRYGKISEPIAKQVFTYSSAEKDALAGPTIRVLNKYAADWMIKYQDEIALATLLTAMTIAKVNAAIALSRMSQTPTTPFVVRQEENTEKDDAPEVKPS